MNKCCYCESSYGDLIVIQNYYWHKQCLISRSRYIDYLQGNLDLEIPEKKISSRERQKQIYNYIKDFIDQYDKPPTIDNLIKNLGYERYTLKNAINALVKKGLLNKNRRTLTLNVSSVD